jgi:hypothetical protein
MIFELVVLLRKWSTYLALTQTLSPNGKKRDSTCPTLPRSSIGCVENNFWALWFIQHKPHTYLASRLALSPNRLNKHPCEPHQLGVLSVCPKWFLSLWYVWRKPCTYLTLTLTLSMNEPLQDSTRPTSPRSSIGCGSKTISEPMVRST